MYSKILSASYSEYLSGKSNHYHDGHQLLYVVRGKAEINVGDQREMVSDGTLILFSRFEEHSIKILGDEYKRYSVRISPDIVKMGDQELLFSILVNRTPGFCHILRAGEHAAHVESMFRRLTREFRSESIFRDEMMDAILRELLITVCRMMPSVSLPVLGEQSRLIYRIQQRFEAEYSEKFTVARLADEYHMSASYLSHIFKDVTGVSMMEYLFACRMQAAKSYLATTDLSIGEIVSACGFSDDSNFSRSFKQRTGQTPSEFRRCYRKGS